MGMATIQFYQNKYDYPKYTRTLTPVGSELSFTPETTGLKAGTVIAAGNMSYFMSCNYIRIKRDGATIFAWIDEVSFHTDSSFYVRYSVDPFRTFESKITLGTQYVKRSSTVTNKFDPLLGSLQHEYNMRTSQILWGNYHARIMVIQVNPEPAFVANNTPVQPTPYHFYFCSYNPDNWQASPALVDFFSKLRASSAVSNIITLYSIPYMNIDALPEVLLPIFEGEEQVETVSGFKMLSGTNDVKNLLTRSRVVPLPPYNALSKIGHSVQIMIPDAGIMNIPDEVLTKGNVKVRQDVDIFSGASNYMLTCGENDELTGISVRGSSTSSIPIISNPYDTYISQNQNALTTSLIGDVASLAGGIGSFMIAPNMMSAGVAAKGVTGLISSYSSLQDKQNMSPSNPPSFLGTAMANHFNSVFFLIVKTANVTNQSLVNERYGYPIETIQNVSVPATGYLELQNCNVSGTGTVPRWALEEINTIFNNGLLII